MNEIKILSGGDKAAVLLLTLGETEAAAVLRHMSPKEVQKIGTAMAALGRVPQEWVVQVLDSFIQQADQETALGLDTEAYIRRILVGALGEDKANSQIDRILHGRGSKGLESMKWMDPRAIAEIIRLEHPQIIAIVLSYLDSDQSAQVLSLLPERMRADILLRIATLDGIPPSAINELDEVLERQFSGNDNLKSSSVGGIKTAANILNFMDSSVESRLIAEVQAVDDVLGQKIQDLMFVFDNLLDVDDRGIQALLREVQSDSLVLALKGADERLREKILGNMSKRAAEMLREDLEAKGPVRLADVETAQKEILAIARKMAEQGQIALGGKGESYV